MAARGVADISDIADEIINEVKNFYSAAGFATSPNTLPEQYWYQ